MFLYVCRLKSLSWYPSIWRDGEATLAKAGGGGAETHLPYRQQWAGKTFLLPIDFFSAEKSVKKSFLSLHLLSSHVFCKIKDKKSLHILLFTQKCVKRSMFLSRFLLSFFFYVFRSLANACLKQYSHINIDRWPSTDLHSEMLTHIIMLYKMYRTCVTITLACTRSL